MTSSISGPVEDVFISYCWGTKRPDDSYDVQELVKRLYARLTSAGYSCWMDIHKMGGGSVLDDEMQKGIDGCKVVLSCVTVKYAESENCRREVKLADMRKKPVIPLLLEQMDWPPKGPMSMIFVQLAYIDFTQAASQWCGKNFDELILQLNKLNVPRNQKVCEVKPFLAAAADDATSNQTTTSSQGLKGVVQTVEVITHQPQTSSAPIIIASPSSSSIIGQTSLELVHTFSAVECVRGLCTVLGRIYITFYSIPKMEIYDVTTFELFESINLLCHFNETVSSDDDSDCECDCFGNDNDPVTVERNVELQSTRSLSACSINRRVYFIGTKAWTTFHLAIDGHEIKVFKHGISYQALSVTSSGQVVLVRRNENFIDVYQHSGAKLFSVKIMIGGIRITSIMQTPAGHFVINYRALDGSHKVGLVNNAGKLVLKEFVNRSPEAIDKPVGQFAIDDKGRVFVADADKCQVIVLDASFSESKVLLAARVEANIGAFSVPNPNPLRMHYSAETRQLIVGHDSRLVEVYAIR